MPSLTERVYHGVCVDTDLHLNRSMVCDLLSSALRVDERASHRFDWLYLVCGAAFRYFEWYLYSDKCKITITFLRRHSRVVLFDHQTDATPFQPALVHAMRLDLGHGNREMVVHQSFRTALRVSEMRVDSF